MIVSIAHKGLRLFWEYGDASKLPAKQVRKIREILDALHSAEQVADIDFTCSGLHPLKGPLKDHWAIKVTANWRIIFRFEQGDVYLVNLLDYH